MAKRTDGDDLARKALAFMMSQIDTAQSSLDARQVFARRVSV